MTFVALTRHQQSWRLTESHWTHRLHHSIFPPRPSPETKVRSDRSVTPDTLTGTTWLSISRLKWECTCHSSPDKLWLAPVHQAGELWKPLMDEIWTSISLSSCLLNKLLLKFTAMFADMCSPSRTSCVLSRGKRSQGGPRTENARTYSDECQRGLSRWAHEAWRQREVRLIG